MFQGASYSIRATHGTLTGAPSPAVETLSMRGYRLRGSIFCYTNSPSGSEIYKGILVHFRLLLHKSRSLGAGVRFVDGGLLSGPATLHRASWLTQSNR
jgi:hypothetical protein